jgi:STE24 endopeptidase
MNWKLLILILLVLGHGYRLALNLVQKRSAANPTPENVADVYDAETYLRWKNYSAEKSALNILSTMISFAVMLVLLVLNVHAWFAGLFPSGAFWQMFGVLLFHTLVETAVNVWSDSCVCAMVDKRLKK